MVTRTNEKKSDQEKTDADSLDSRVSTNGISTLQETGGKKDDLEGIGAAKISPRAKGGLNGPFHK